METVFFSFFLFFRKKWPVMTSFLDFQVVSRLQMENQSKKKK